MASYTDYDFSCSVAVVLAPLHLIEIRYAQYIFCSSDAVSYLSVRLLTCSTTSALTVKGKGGCPLKTINTK